MKIPFLDLGDRATALRATLDQAYHAVMESGCFIQGPHLAAFEDHFSQACQSGFCVGVGNGLDALSLILQAHGIGSGDHVIVPSHTSIATWLAVTAVGATPVPAEPHPRTWNLDVTSIEAAITSKTRAVIVVHLYGQCAEMEPILDLARHHDLHVIEDAAQAAGGRLHGRPAGSFGDAAAFSFFPTKNLGAFGDGGAIVTSSAELAERVRKLGSYGGLQRNEHEILGRNSRLDELQAAFLDACLPRLESDNERRRQLASLYHHDLQASPRITFQEVPDSVEPTWHLLVARVENRDRVRTRLAEAGIGTAIHYPMAPGRTAAFRDHGIPAQPLAEALAREVLSLPLHPHLTDAEAHFVSQALLKAVK